MTRLVLGIALVLALTASACSSTDDGPGERSGPMDTGRDAEEFRTEMDSLARKVLPDLHDALGGRFTGLEAHFYERGGFGLWEYTATGQVQEPRGSRAKILSAAAEVLRAHGMEVEQDDSGAFGTLGNVGVQVEPALDADVAKVGLLNVSIASIEPVTSEGEYAEEAAPEDYLAYLG